MSIQSQISRINANIDSTYKVLEDAGAEMPQTRNSGNLPAAAASIGIGIVPDYWRSYLTSKATEINNALNSASANSASFLWYTDAHWSTNYGMSPMLLKYLSKHTGVKKTFYGGDIAVNETGEIASITAWQELVKDIPNHHSVIGNHDNNCTDFSTVPAKADFFVQYNRSGDMSIGTHATNGKMYYYIDNHIESTRYICLSTGRMWTNADEVKWCVEVLNNTPKDWHIVVISHLWLNNDYSNNGAILTTPVDYTQGYLDMFDAYNYRLSGTESFTSTAYDFTNAQGKIEFIIGGHVHQDYDFTTTKGIPVILTECDSWQERDSVSVATKGTTTENCVYAVIADFDARQVKLINVGRGDTRSNTIPKVVTYTNVLRNALSLDTTGLYNGELGYKTSTRISVSSGVWEDKSEKNWCATGLIRATAGDVIRLRNCKFAKSNPGTGTHRAGVFGANASGAFFNNYNQPMSLVSTGNENSQPVFDTDNDNIIQFNVPANFRNAVYIRLVGQEFTADSIITVNQEID